MSRITIEGMEFFAYHGCFEEEQIIGNKFVIDLSMKVDARIACDTDDLAHTVNYQRVYEVIKSEMQVNSKLLEHLSKRIMKAIMKNFPMIEKAELKVCKLNPPIGGKVDKVCFILKEENKCDEGLRKKE